MQPANGPIKEKLELFTALCLLVAWVGLTFSPALVEIFSTAAIFLWFLLRFKTKKILSFFHPAMLWTLGIYFTLCLVSVFFSDYPDRSLRGMVKIFQFSAIFVIVADTFREEKYRRWFEWVTLCVFTVLILNGIWQYVTGVDFIRGFHAQPSGAGYRIQASFKSYGLLASYLISVLPLIIVLGFKAWTADGKKRRAVFIWIVAVAGFFILLLTRSRGAILALTAGLGLFLLWRKYWKILFVFILLIGTVVWCVPKDTLIHKDSEGKEQSVIERFHLWDRAAQVIQARPWTGIGINTYAAAHDQYDRRKNWRVRGYYAHNGYLQMAAETGVPSLLVFLLFIFFYFKYSFFRTGNSEARIGFVTRSALLIGALNFLLFMGVDTIFHNDQSVTVFWYVLGVQYSYLVSLAKTAHEPSSSEAPGGN